MKKKALVLLASAAVTAVVLAGCSNKNQTAATEGASSSAEESESTAEQTTEAPKEEEKAGLVIAGGDGAGLAAAIQAVEEGLDPSRILIVESSEELASDVKDKEAFINAADTQLQFDAEIEDSFEAYLADILKAGNNKNSQELAEHLAESGEEAMTWLNGLGIQVGNPKKQEGSSAARSYSVKEGAALNEALSEALVKKAEELKIPVETKTSVKEILYNENGAVSGVKLESDGKEKTVDCIALLVTDESMLPLFQNMEIQFTKGADDKENGLLVNNCTEVLKAGEENESVQGLYAAGSLIGSAVHGEKVLAGDDMTAMIVFGRTAGTESSIYVSDNTEK